MFALLLPSTHAAPVGFPLVKLSEPPTQLSPFAVVIVFRKPKNPELAFAIVVENVAPDVSAEHAELPLLHAKVLAVKATQ
jgi:hypothetical protein